jgi:predicted restriction endonuclease
VDDHDEPPEGMDDDEYRLRSIKTRRGQSKFRQKLLEAYKGKCIVTGCRVEAILEAAHITPHAEHTDYRVSNGLLLRSDIHTLFDLNLLTIDSFHRVKISPQLKQSEYWQYNDRLLSHIFDASPESPNPDALRARAQLLK